DKILRSCDQAVPSLSGVTSSRRAVNHLLKSVVREVCTLRSVGIGGGRPPPVTRSEPIGRATRPVTNRYLQQATKQDEVRVFWRLDSSPSGVGAAGQSCGRARR